MTKHRTRNEILEDAFPEGIAGGIRALTTQLYTEANVKNGVQYEAAAYNPALASLAVTYFVLQTGSKPVALKGRRIEFDGLGLQSMVYEGPTFTGGANLPVFNHNHKNPVAGEVVLLVGVAVTDEGTQVQATKTFLGASLNGNQIQAETGQEAEGLEYIYAANSEYLFKLESIDGSDAQRVATFVTFYEGDLDLPLP